MCIRDRLIGGAVHRLRVPVDGEAGGEVVGVVDVVEDAGVDAVDVAGALPEQDGGGRVRLGWLVLGGRQEQEWAENRVVRALVDFLGGVRLLLPHLVI